MSRKPRNRKFHNKKNIQGNPKSPGSKNEEEIKLTSVSFNVEIYNPRSENEEDSEKKEQLNELISVGHGFTTVLQMLWKYINSIGVLAETTSATSFGTLAILLDEINHIAKNRTDKPIAELEIQLQGLGKDNEEKTNKNKVKIYDHSHLAKIIEFKQHNQAALSILHESSIQQLVNAWEKLIADILNWYYQHNQDKITDTHSLSYNQILQFSNLDEAKQSVIDSEVKNFLKKTTNEQLKFLNSTFNINFQSIFKDTDLLNEIILTRHLIVHYGGIATTEYINKLKKLNNGSIEHPNPGDKVVLEPSYIISSWGKIYVAGTMLIHLIAKKSLPDFHKSYDNFINNSAYQNIQKKQLGSAIKLLEYATDTHISDTKLLWIIKLNLAQAYKWNGEEDKCNEILDSSEWDVANVLFELCVSSLKNNSELFVQNLKEVARKCLLSITELYEWPIFHTMREHNDFDQWIEEAFGYKLNKYRGLLEQKVLDCNPDITAKNLSEYFSSKNKSI